MIGVFAMFFVLSPLSFISASIRVDLRTCSFSHIVNKMTRELLAKLVCVFSNAGCFVTVEDLAAVLNECAVLIFDLLLA